MNASSLPAPADTASIMLVALLAGTSAAALAAVLAHSLITLPQEDRTWLDRPPRFMHALWWPTRWIAQAVDPLLPARGRERLLTRLRLAGLDYAVSPAQLLAHRIAVGGLGALFAALVAHGWQVPVLASALVGALAGSLLAWSWFNDRARARRRHLLKQLPFVLDLITLCIEAGLNLNGALQQAVAKGPAGPLRDELQRVLRDVRAGKSRAEALRRLAVRIDETAVTSLVSAIIQAENMGMSLGPVLRAQGEQRRGERFARAEKAAMEAPVKMLLPLIAFIFPCTFLVLGFPIAMKFLAMGL
ncbi:type II secretion system F family protein [Thauera sp. WH-1]|uniref:type II secretion system F family protein n=1 Tax=Thauera sp. WH-1 TaxID=3398230 RepID=UPI0039FC80B4